MRTRPRCVPVVTAPSPRLALLPPARSAPVETAHAAYQGHPTACEERRSRRRRPPRSPRRGHHCRPRCIVGACGMATRMPTTNAGPGSSRSTLLLEARSPRMPWAMSFWAGSRVELSGYRAFHH
eukprot:15467138-Alexandrium_andersonii.AAC.1